MKSNLLKLATIAAAVSLAACGSDDDNSGNTGRSGDVALNSAFDVTNPKDTDQVYKYYGDTSDGGMNGPSNYGALAYGVDGYTMFANFTTYLFKDGENYYKAQVLSNYGEEGDLGSGNLYIRYAQLGGQTEYMSIVGTYETAGYADLVNGSNTTVEQDWHFSYQRGIGFTVNSGISGEGNIVACAAHTPNGLYNEDGTANADAFKALTYENTLASFEAVTAESCAAEDLIEDSLKTQISSDHWVDTSAYPVVTALVSTDNGWIVKSSTDDGNGNFAYGRVAVSELDYQTTNHIPTKLAITLAVETWDDNGQVFEAVALSPELDFTMGKVYWDLETNEIAQEADDWELSVALNGRSLDIQVNGGASGNGDAGIGLVITEE